MNLLRALLDRVPPLAMACIAMIVVAALALVSGVSAYLATLAANPDAAAPDREQAQIEAFRAGLDGHVAQINGRSLFITPGPPRPSRVDPPRVDTGPRPPVTPTRYGGPSIIAMINGAVWFSDGQRLATGESGRGVEVVSIDPPWGAKVRWQGAEFDVSLFARDAVVNRSNDRSNGGGSQPSATGSLDITPSSLAPLSPPTALTPQPEPAQVAPLLPTAPPAGEPPPAEPTPQPPPTQSEPVPAPEPTPQEPDDPEPTNEPESR